jgi:hypothetical protein
MFIRSKFFFISIILVFQCLFILSAKSAKAADDFYNIPLMKKAPPMNGYVNPQEWKGADRFDGFSMSGVLQPRRVIGYVGATENDIYIAIDSELPKQGKILAAVKSNTINIVFDDAVEVWIDPNPGKENGVTYQMLCNSLGYRYYQIHPRGHINIEKYYGWDGHYRIVNGFHNGWWDCEIKIPVKNLVKGRKTTDGQWQINICRDFKQPWAFACIGNGSFNFTPVNQIIFKFSKENGVVVQQKNLTNPIYGNINYVVSIYNPLEKQIGINAKVLLKRDTMPNLSKQSNFILNPGEEKEITMKVFDQVTNKFELSTVISSSSGKKMYFSRNYAWQNWGKPGSPKEVLWQTGKIKPLPPINFLFANYPYLHKMKILADISRLGKNSQVKQLNFKIVNVKTKELVKEFDMGINEFKNGKCEKVINLPPLDGNYEIILKAKGKNVPSGEIVKTFENQVFPWEHAHLGESHKVYPPFIPIKKEGNNLYTILKQYTINNLGLLSSVITQENDQEPDKKEILNGNMGYIATINGKEYTPEKAKLQYKKVSGYRVIMSSKFNIGGAPISSVSKLDYDGTLKVEVTLLPSPKRIDSLILNIPLKNRIAKYMHAMADGIRGVILTASVPSGQGVVWNATKIVPAEFPKNFCTYIFLGNSRRGLCWFASNDKGWSWNHDKANLQIAREGKTLTLQINLVNKPIIVTKPRTIIFGILAAPVKPRFKGWRYKWYTDHYSVIGTDINWFALGDCSSVYPVAKDLYLWKMMKEGTEKHLSNALIEKIYKRVLKDYAPYEKPMEEAYGRNTYKDYLNLLKIFTWHDLSNYHLRMIFYYDRATGYAASPEFQTFMNEWCEQNFVPYRGENAVNEIDCIPSKSYDDYAIYWFNKSFKIAGNQGVYLDNWFLQSSYNTMMTSAYREKDGNIMPSVGIWKMRHFIRRIFEDENELGMKLPIVMPHMTSTSILPILSFATFQYDWEWHYSQGDVQNRFQRKYIRIVSDGELAGTWPVLLGDEGPLANNPWTAKTYMGVTLIHDLIGQYPIWVPAIGRLWKTYREPFVKMAQDNKNMIAYRYWDSKQQPVYSKNYDLPGIVYSVFGKEALYGVCSYANINLETTIHVIPDILGFTHYKVINAATGKEVPVENNTFNIFIKKHDLEVFKIEP